MKKYSLGALVAAGLLVGGLSAGSASAADLGGNCCADLEERIAELEATTARKGNRKVSLTISGWVAEQVMWLGRRLSSRTSTSVVSAPRSPRHFKFTGQATISPGWYAGYVIHVEADGSDDAAGDQSGRRSQVPACSTAPTQLRADAAVVLVRQERPPRQVVASVCSRRLRTTPPSWLTVRARSFPPTACRSTTVASSSRDTADWWPSRLLSISGVMGCVDCNGIPQNSSATTRRPSPVSRCRLLGVRTTSGTSPLATRVSGTASRSPLPLPTACPRRLAYQGVTASSDARCRYWSTATCALHSTRPSSMRPVLPGWRLRRARPTGLFLYGAYGNYDS